MYQEKITKKTKYVYTSIKTKCIAPDSRTLLRGHLYDNRQCSTMFYAYVSNNVLRSCTHITYNLQYCIHQAKGPCVVKTLKLSPELKLKLKLAFKIRVPVIMRYFVLHLSGGSLAGQRGGVDFDSPVACRETNTMGGET